MTRQELMETIKQRQDEMSAIAHQAVEALITHVLCSHTVIAQEDCVTVGPITSKFTLPLPRLPRGDLSNFEADELSILISRAISEHATSGTVSVIVGVTCIQYIFDDAVLKL